MTGFRTFHPTSTWIQRKLRKHFSTLNEQEGVDLLVSADGDDEKDDIIFNLHKFISSLIPFITSYTINLYNTGKREREAAAKAMAAVKTAEIEDTTRVISDIIDSEESMSCKYMEKLPTPTY